MTQLPAEITQDSAQVAQMKAALRIQLTDDETVYEAATSFIADRIQPGIKRIVEYFRPLKKVADEAHKALTKAEREALTPYEEVKAQVEREATAWRRNQQMLRDEALRKERAEALAKAEAEATEQATALADAGDIEGATELLAAPVMPAPIVSQAPIIPKPSGVVGTKRWVCEIQDESELLKWIAADINARRHFLAGFSQRALDAKASSDRTAMRIPGCIAKEVESTQFRSGKDRT